MTVAQPKPPELAAFLVNIDESRLEDLLIQFSDRAEMMTRAGDPESLAWASLYQFFGASLEVALLNATRAFAFKLSVQSYRTFTSGVRVLLGG